MLYYSGGDSVVLGIASASPTSGDLGPRLHKIIRFGVGGTLKLHETTTPKCPPASTVSSGTLSNMFRLSDALRVVHALLVTCHI